MRPGDVYEVDHPQVDGREQAGQRPSLILQDEAYAGLSPLVVTIPFTTASRVTRFPAVIPVSATPENGLTQDSHLLVFQIRSSDRARLKKQLGAVDPAILAEAYAALDKLTGRP
jgi:mRNA interferase MazF